MNTRRDVLAFALFLLLGGAVFSQMETAGRVSFEFINQNITDILYVFSTYANISIIADDTVSGTGSLQFNGTSFDQAFDAFLLTNRLYVEKT
jgi:type II secretory pathway component HofQ